MDSNRQDQFVYKQPKTFDERRELAKVLVDRLDYRIPVAIDGMDNRAETLFGAWPERIYVLEPGGRVVFKGGMGPFGFHPEEGEKALDELLAKRGG